ncbi:ribonuclease H2 catalytic subunit RNH201 NDAI_0F02410 [Naumovozyma dairenensis CBS 421]|uniref:Ribonuclease n=1 Tax=Naumovozyma dairenensis (strain ATCC 10597 / BCRC 20456 / CBS 421 / NBRC 0211 / NRRL Y-12639) TaxID=1071378 RepID=G0WCP8_NAUDC|nr:hypothetical protein NDAI_0F02410 [Naumovozyma dairenensis CBS 421]CCD25559.1 hypothetical protein NDAI_0F02410 [Naumovozyma dairenensis CBS 421]
MTGSSMSTTPTLLPPTVESALQSIHTTSYFSPVPPSILGNNDASPIIMGVDEAGRGPVLGPMVYGVSYCTEEYQNETIIPNYEFDDSKKLTDPIRRKLFSKMYRHNSHDLQKDEIELDSIGYATTSITPLDISSGMLKYPPEKVYNLNEQAHDVTMALIQGVLNLGVNLSHVYVDTVGPSQTYQKKLQDRFPSVEFTVTKKADSLFCVVSVASVVAKVTRDILVESLKRPEVDEIIGSGYPSDAKTTKWLRENQTLLFGWPKEMVRFSWQTCQTLLKKNDEANGLLIQWEEDFINSKEK